MDKTTTIFLVHGYNGIPKIFEYFKTEFEAKDLKVTMPNFPTQTEITKERYFGIFEKHKNDLTENTILIAHSIGNIMAVKYLCANNLKIRGYISLAGFGEPFEKEGREDLNKVIHNLRFTTEETQKAPALVGEAYALYSDDDHIVPLEILKEYPKIIGARDFFIPGIGHMGRRSGLEELPEVIKLVNKIVNKNSGDS